VQPAKSATACCRNRPTTSRYLWFGNALTFKSFCRFGCITYARILSIVKGAKVDPVVSIVAFWATSVYHRGFSCFGTSNMHVRYNPGTSDSLRDNPQRVRNSLTFQIALHRLSFLLLTMWKSTWNPFPSTMIHMKIYLTAWTSAKYPHLLQSLTICTLANLERV
jgi:hypothetical protein